MIFWLAFTIEFEKYSEKKLLSRVHAKFRNNQESDGIPGRSWRVPIKGRSLKRLINETTTTNQMEALNLGPEWEL